jgi:hypothetical protein
VVNFAVDYCKIMENSVITNPVFNLYFGMVKKFTNLHRCPIKKLEETVVRNFTIDYNLIPSALLVLNGQFRLDILYFSTKFGENVYYTKVQLYITILRRVPYKKRTQTGGNF